MNSRPLPSTFICGAVRNGGAGFVKTLAVIDRLKPLLADCAVAIVTNDNTDGTDGVIADWAASSAQHHVIRLDGMAKAVPDRIDRLAMARNFYLDFLRAHTIQRFEQVLVMDLDGPNEAIDPIEFTRVVSTQPKGWDGLFPNQRKAYYDIYALRHDTWCPTDCWDEVRRATRTRTLRQPFKSQRGRAARKHFVYDRQIKIPPEHPAFRVRSAFGGLGLYRAEALTHCWYGTKTADGAPCCDHVVVNEEITRRGGKLFIVPALLNEAPDEHLRPESGRPIPAWLRL
jgi:hypothetical protein